MKKACQFIGEEGATMVDAALVSGVLFLTIFMFIALSTWLFTKIMLDQAAAAALSYAVNERVLIAETKKLQPTDTGFSNFLKARSDIQKKALDTIRGSSIISRLVQYRIHDKTGNPQRLNESISQVLVLRPFDEWTKDDGAPAKAPPTVGYPDIVSSDYSSETSAYKELLVEYPLNVQLVATVSLPLLGDTVVTGQSSGFIELADDDFKRQLTPNVPYPTPESGPGAPDPNCQSTTSCDEDYCIGVGIDGTCYCTPCGGS